MERPKGNQAHNKHYTQIQQHERARPNPYFEKFTTNGFLPKPNAKFENEFDRLAEHMGWPKLGNAYRKHRSQAFKHQGEAQIEVTPPGPQKHDNSFFAKFVVGGFRRNTNASFDEEFNDLARHMGWSKTSKQFRKNRILAAKQEVEVNYGSGSKLQGWQQLCEDVGIGPAPSSVKQCKNVCIPMTQSCIVLLTIFSQELAKLYINLYDLIDWRRHPEPRIPFKQHKKSLSALRKYSIQEHKIFPKEEAKKEGFIKALLRPIFK